MRSFIILALLSLLVAVAQAGPDFVTFINKAYQKVSGAEFQTYWGSPAGACININKAFDNSKTIIITQGRSVELFSGSNCKDKYKTSPATSSRPAFLGHAIKSFKVGKK
ncbi:hypothetical protein IWW38_003273 [Coemansia aciculifera]|uniref:Uncharacterized protein n=1 Tax=Coemansia aciculifera TaxID=417176 RepID=A0ACC1M268_9FUNG|nr:hypothetical protein IWW38_003273 [Coemansia aciculifera]